MTTKDESIKKRQERIRRCQLLKEELENYNSRTSLHLGAQLNTNNNSNASQSSFSVPVSAEAKEAMNNDAVLFPRRPNALATTTDSKPITNDLQGMPRFYFRMNFAFFSNLAPEKL